MRSALRSIRPAKSTRNKTRARNPRQAVKLAVGSVVSDALYKISRQPDAGRLAADRVDPRCASAKFNHKAAPSLDEAFRAEPASWPKGNLKPSVRFQKKPISFALLNHSPKAQRGSALALHRARQNRRDLRARVLGRRRLPCAQHLAHLGTRQQQAVRIRMRTGLERRHPAAF